VKCNGQISGAEENLAMGLVAEYLSGAIPRLLAPEERSWSQTTLPSWRAMMRTARTILEAGPPRPGEHKERDATVLARVVALKRMPVNDLKAEWKALFGTEAPNNSRSFLELRLAHRIQELTCGGVARETARLLNGLADEVQGKPGRKSMIAASRNPVVGTRLLREWDGTEHTVTVMKDGLRLAGPQVQVALGGRASHHRHPVEWLPVLWAS
jgi:hypothetical protein